jgi:hypothetical protein
MKCKTQRAPVFLQLLAHRERWRWRAACFSFRSHDLDGTASAREPLRLGGSRFLSSDSTLEQWMKEWREPA